MAAVCASIEQDVDIILQFLSNVTHVDIFPPGFLDRRLGSSPALFATLAAVTAFVLLVLALLLVPRIRALIKSRPRYRPVPEEDELFRPSDDAGVRRDITCEHLGLRLKTGQIVLQDVSYTFKSGHITALMGPSGSGKTSLLTALAGRADSYGTVTGRTLINGIECKLSRFQRSIGFVPQEDTMFRDCTVLETLRFSARSRLDRFRSLRQMDGVVTSVLSLLGLTEIAESLIGDEVRRGVSGGQRKRVNLGIELCAMPSTLLLDEPTSGLDSGSSMEMMRALRKLADEKHLTIVAVVHQPSFSLLSLFDNIVLLSKGGRMAFSGPVRMLQPYFQDELGFSFSPGENCVDVCLDAISGLRESRRPGVTAASIPDLWRDQGAALHVQEGGGTGRGPLSVGGDASPATAASAAAADGNEERVDVMAPPEQLVPVDGTRGDFAKWLGLGFIFPPIALASFHSERHRTRLGQYGALLGYALMLTTVASVLIRLVSLMPGYWLAAVMTFVSLDLLLAAVAMLGLWIAFRRRDSVSVLTHFVVGASLGPVSLALFPLFREKLKYAVVAGFGLWLVAFGCGGGAFCFVLLFSCAPTDSTCLSSVDIKLQLLIQVFIFLFVMLGFALMSIALSRWKRIPSSDREISGFLRQTYEQSVRAFLQYLRDPFGVAFDLGLPLFSGIATGVLSLGKAFTPPLTELSTWANNATHCLGCGLAASAVPPRIMALCKMLNLSEDFYPPLSLMAGMGLGLTGVTSSLRLFANKAVFSRESRVGLSTEAYYLGRMLLHLLVSAAATFLYAMPLYWLVAPKCHFSVFFASFFLLYLACSGVGFWTSVVLSPSLAGLIAILVVLTFMLFGGSLFIYGVAMPPFDEPLPVAFWVISLVSPLRWHYENLVLIMVEPLRHFMRDPSMSYYYTLWGFSFEHMAQTWVALGLIAFFLRVVPYLALVSNEKK